jgi:PAS domain S-box-containing protein
MSAIQDHMIKDQLFEAIPWLGIGMRAWKVLRANKPAAALFGYDEQEIIGIHVDAFVPDEYLAKHIAGREAFQANPHCYDFGEDIVVHLKRKDGSIVKATVLPRGNRELFDQGLVIVIVRRLDLTAVDKEETQ